MSTVAKKVLMGSGATEIDPLDIEQSLILDSGSASVLSFTPSSSGSRTTWTFSTWLKVKSGSDNIRLFGYQDPGGPHQQSLLSMTSGAQLQFHDDKGGTGAGLVLNRLFRDPSAWYHIVMVMDTTQSTAANRVRFYINGELETSFAQANYPGQNASPYLNSGGALNQINYQRTNTSNCQLAETQFIDGTALTPSSFGKTNSDTGQWVAIEYSGSYGTNGFRLKFVSGAIGTDSSGEGNNYTATNLANSDVVIDTPTNNFCNFSSICGNSRLVVLSEGNLYAPLRGNTTYPGQNDLSGTLAIPTSGKWYWEIRYQSSGRSGYSVGMQQVSDAVMSASGSFGYSYYNAGGGQKNFNGTSSAYGDEWFDINQVYKLSIYYDADLGKIGFKLNGVDQGFAFTDVLPAEYVPGVKFQSGNTQNIVNTTGNFGQNGTFSGSETAQGNADANGIGDFYYAPPSGYLALCTANLPDPAIALPSAQFNTVLYTGNGSTQSISGVGHQPDFVWIKNRAAADNHKLTDAVRGVTKELESNTTDAEATNADGLTAFASNGFALGDDDEYNTNSEAYVSWNWKANGAGSTDTSGDIDSVVSANQAAGFSIVTWTGDGSEGNTLAHGLGVVPELIIRKIKNAASSWATLTTVIDGSNDQLYLNLTNAKSNLPAGYGSLTSSFMMNMEYTSSHNVVAYCFASKPGFSKINTYKGNGNADGPYINCGFKPAWILIKNSSSGADTASWVLFDIKRSPFNVVDKVFGVEGAASEYTVANLIDITSNGFKMRDTHNSRNTNGHVYLYMAFAEAPFKTANAR